MNFHQAELCFVCNRDVQDKGTLLSMETTLYSKTTFPTKLTQLLGDAFMVVIVEDDKICNRCANLINRSDKLEQDLKETKSIIIEFLSEKYDLSGQGISSTAEELQDPEDIYTHNKDNLMHSTSINIKYNERYKSNNNLESTEKSIKSGTISENAHSVKIKSEPVINSDQYSNYNSSLSSSESCNYTVSEAVLRKLPLDDTAVKEQKSNLNSCESELNQIFQESQGTISKVMKEEKQSVDSCENIIKIALSFTNNLPSSISESEKSVSVLQSDDFYLDESKIKSLCDNSRLAKDKNVVLTSEMLSNHELPKDIGCKFSDTGLPNTAAEKKLRNERERSTSGKQSNRKCMKKEKTENRIRKLRPILPKVSSIKEALSSFYIIPNSDSREVLNDRPKPNLFIKSEVSDIIKSKRIKLPNRERETSSIQCALNETVQLGPITKISLTGSLNTHCAICNVDFIDVKNLKTHEKEHLKESYKCSFCPKSFKRKSSIRNHEVLHTGNYSHYCEFCGQGFSAVSKLEQHRRRHTKEESYMCDICGKKFHFQGTYWIHRKWHDNPFPYKCDECGKPFKHTSQLAVHRRKHKGERPYKCPYCPLMFNVSQSLKRHLVLHTKQYPYKCVACDQGFTSRSKYTDHLARKHDTFVEKPSINPEDYKMAVCDNKKKQTDNEITMDFGESNFNIEFPEEPELIFHNNPSDCHIEIILPPSSMVSDNSLSNISWLA